MDQHHEWLRRVSWALPEWRCVRCGEGRVQVKPKGGAGKRIATGVWSTGKYLYFHPSIHSGEYHGPWLRTRRPCGVAKNG